jgi:hypothetical protein
MDPVLKRWCFEHWLGDKKDDAELAKNHAYLLASFDHPDTVKQLVGEGNIRVSTEEEFDESTRMVREMNLKSLGLSDLQNKDQEVVRKKRKRRLIKE